MCLSPFNIFYVSVINRGSIFVGEIKTSWQGAHCADTSRCADTGHCADILDFRAKFPADSVRWRHDRRPATPGNQVRFTCELTYRIASTQSASARVLDPETGHQALTLFIIFFFFFLFKHPPPIGGADAYMFYSVFTAARPAYAGTEGCYEMLVFFFIFFI